jgi:ATP-dependent DNA helicase RecQ
MGDFSIITDYGGSLQVTLSGSRLDVLGFYHGRKVAVTEEFGRITISLASGSVLMDSPPNQAAEPVIEAVPDSSAEAAPRPESVLLSEPVSDSSSEVLTEIVQAETLLQRLTALRKKIAAEQGLPAYIIFHDKTLQEICRLLPSDLQTFGTIQGVGSSKLAKYGSRFLEVVREYVEASHG